MASPSKAPILRPAPTGERIALSDGSVAEVVDDGLELRAPDGRLLLRYADGDAELFAPRGDLRLRAPEGKIVLESATDVELVAARDVIQRPARRAVTTTATSTFEVSPNRIAAKAPRLEVHARKSQFASGETTILARHIATSAERIVTEVERYERTAKRVVERSRDTFREVSDLLQEKAGRMRTQVAGLRALYSKRTVMVSEKETSIDGEKVLLG